MNRKNSTNSQSSNKSLLLSTGTPAAKLIMAGTTIGNPDDIPTRSLEALRTADLLIFEEDRPARFALKSAGIHREYLRHSEHNNDLTMESLRQCFKEGKTACYMSDQGMPVFADPGQKLLTVAYEMNVQIEIIPGPSSLTAAFAACPFLTGEFTYAGFLDRRPQKRLQKLEKLGKLAHPFVILDAPYRLQALISDCFKAFPQRKALLAVDISGPNENYLYGTVSKLNKRVESQKQKLNFVLIVNNT